MNRRVLTMASQTVAFKAKRALQRHNILVKIVRPSPRLTGSGCIYGIEADANRISEIIGLLEEYEIPFLEILGGMV